MNPFTYPLETSENQKFSNAFKGYRSKLMTYNQSTSYSTFTLVKDMEKTGKK